VIPILLIAIGACSVGAGIVVLRTFGAGYRIGRILAAAPAVSIDRALADARSGAAVQVRIAGRIDSVDEFEDEYHRPLVWRRQVLEMQREGRWQTLDEQVEAVDFEIRDGLAAIAVATGDLGEGIVVVPRESIGTAAEAPERVPDGTPPETPVRLRIEQVSSVEHAIAVGVPRLDLDGTPRVGAGDGRPLVLTTLEVPEAMRILAGGDRRRSWTASSLLVAGVLVAGTGLAWALLASFRGAPG